MSFALGTAVVFLLYQKGRDSDGSSSCPGRDSTGSSSYRSLIRYPGSAISQSRNEAAPPLESPLPVDPLGFGVDVRETDFDVFRPERHQAYLGYAPHPISLPRPSSASSSPPRRSRSRSSASCSPTPRRSSPAGRATRTAPTSRTRSSRRLSGNTKEHGLAGKRSKPNCSTMYLVHCGIAPASKSCAGRSTKACQSSPGSSSQSTQP